MLRKSKFRCVAPISLSLYVYGFAPAAAGDCGLDGCSGRYLIQQTPDSYGGASTRAGYVSVLARYCDGFGGGQNPYATCSVGRTAYIATPPAPAVIVVKAPTSPPGPLPIVTKYRADDDHTSPSAPAVVARAPPPSSSQLPIVTKYRADAQ